MNTQKPAGLPLWQVFANEERAKEGLPALPVPQGEAEPTRADSEPVPALHATADGTQAAYLCQVIRSQSRLLNPADGITFPESYATKARAVEVWLIAGRYRYLLIGDNDEALAGRSRPPGKLGAQIPKRQNDNATDSPPIP